MEVDTRAATAAAMAAAMAPAMAETTEVDMEVPTVTKMDKHLVYRERIIHKVSGTPPLNLV